MGIRERSAERRKRIVTHKANSHEEAEAWDIAFWQQQTPEQRLQALWELREGAKYFERERARQTRQAAE
jgi:hypothetical protein